MSNNERQLLNMEREISKIQWQMRIINAQLTKNIWTDPIFDKFDYSSRSRLRDAELILQLSSNPEYQQLLSQKEELEFQLVDEQKDTDKSNTDAPPRHRYIQKRYLRSLDLRSRA